ncbi:SOUL heme-binding protein [Halogranum gelatinilyticum]|uniref:SOUL heme-binding protein n=1 Tax=Halogranum gelatinilyticum TaxID=660521 RepID=A0A1G9XYU0_9EURY|nr:heme-binding protein [Halogranum gelatinilyticum]SDN01949.1 SOUL heme-binding protein [Halogranum gelatinilyticum]
MRTLTKSLLAVGGAGLALWTGWGLYSTRSTERVPYDTLAELDGVEIRRYPRTILVETTAESNEAAFRRLFRYLSGANESSEEVSMTAPVASDADGQTVSMTAPVRTERATTGARDTDSDELSMTAPVRTDDGDGEVTMAFYLPSEYTPATAPTPTDSRVRLVVQPPQTLAVKTFSWWATDERVTDQRSALLDTLAERDLDLRGEPFLLQYNAPYTPPFLRRNEVAVAVAYEPESVDNTAE